MNSMLLAALRLAVLIRFNTELYFGGAADAETYALAQGLLCRARRQTASTWSQGEFPPMVRARIFLARN